MSAAVEVQSANDRNRPESVTHAGLRERLIPDPKADVAWEENIARAVFGWFVRFVRQKRTRKRWPEAFDYSFRPPIGGIAGRIGAQKRGLPTSEV